ncbi:MAG: hypothetical protein RQ729_12470 [Wenzhouxiangellaceae bacterium]|nr:hypothetical protein [Wenzhouxiangellaceae bacterium]
MRDRDDRPETEAPRVSSEQRSRAASLATGLSMDVRFNKRNVNEDFQSGMLQHPQVGSDVPIKITRKPFEGNDYYILLCTRELPEVRNADIALRRPGGEVHLEGRVHRIREGQRAEDQTDDGRVIVYHFYEFYPSNLGG